MRVFLILVIGVGLVCGWFILQRDKREREERYWATELKTHLHGMLGEPDSRHPQVEEPLVFKLLAFMHKAEASHVDFSKMISDACADLSLDDSAANLVKDSLMSNFSAAKGLGVFDDPENLMKLDRGDAPTTSANGWKGEKLAVAQVVPGQLAPDAAQCLPNLVVVPALVRDAWSDLVTSTTLDRAFALQQNHFMSKGSLDQVTAAKFDKLQIKGE